MQESGAQGRSSRPDEGVEGYHISFNVLHSNRANQRGPVYQPEHELLPSMPPLPPIGNGDGEYCKTVGFVSRLCPFSCRLRCGVT